jgi:hypothetical protein
MTSVNITRTKGAAYTWATASFNWKSGDGSKTWATSSQYDYSCDIGEGFSIGESFKKSFILKLDEILECVESISKNVSISKNESFSISEDYTTSTTFIKHLDELIGIADIAAKSIGLNKSETLSLVDTWIRNAYAVISDFLIRENEITEAEFLTYLNRGSADGFSNFVTFVPGYYQFKDSIIRYSLNAVSSDRPQIKHLDAVVDMPDIVNRGSVNTVDTGVSSITFSRPFNIIPEVIGSQTGGTTVGVVEITNITSTSFDIGLKSGSDYIEGKISWVAHGY